MIYTIFGGVNGAGKSTIFQLLSDAEKANLGVRINVDELVSSMGSWQDVSVQMKAARQTVANIKYCLDNNISFNQETTLAGQSIIATAKKAKTKGYEVNLNYVFVNDVEIAKTRVHERVKKGGHGVSDELIERRFDNSLKNLKLIIPFCDTINIFNNTDHFLNVVIIKEEHPIYLDKNIPNFILEIFKT